MASANVSRIKKMQAVALQRHIAYMAGLTDEEFRNYSRRVLGSVRPEEAAQDMREFGYTEEMVERTLKYIYDDGDDEEVKGDANAR